MPCATEAAVMYAPGDTRIGDGVGAAHLSQPSPWARRGWKEAQEIWKQAVAGHVRVQES